MKFNPNLPIYLQVMDEIKKEIVTQVYLPQQKIPSVRELALKYNVNPNTIQKALSELEREELLRSERTIGRFVTDNLEIIEQLRISLSTDAVKEYVTKMEILGFSREEMAKVVEEYETK